MTATNNRLPELERAFARHQAATQPLAWLHADQSAALKVFAARGFPTTRDEEWKYTSLERFDARATRYLDTDEASADGGAGIQAALDALPGSDQAIRLIVLDGRLDTARSSLTNQPDGLRISSLAESGTAPSGARPGHLASIEESPMAAFNAAFMTDGLVIEVAPDARIERPIHVIVLNSDRRINAHPRIVMQAGERSHVELIEHHAGLADSVTNAITEIDCAKDARVRYLKIQDDSPTGHHVAAQHVALSAGSRFEAVTIDVGGELVRNDLNVRLAGAGAEATIHGLYLATGTQHIDNHLVLDHAAPNTRSEETCRGIADQQGRAVFNGRIVVRPGADGTDAALSNRNLLLSPTAEVDTKPELEIYADDVKCAHGATTGRLDETALFYLRSRGVELARARQLLILAFAQAVIDEIDEPALHAHLSALLGERVNPEAAERLA